MGFFCPVFFSATLWGDCDPATKGLARKKSNRALEKYERSEKGQTRQKQKGNQIIEGTAPNLSCLDAPIPTSMSKFAKFLDVDVEQF